VGIGPDSAVTLLITMGGNPDRLNTEVTFAARCGVSPIEYSTGRRITRRLNFGGDRQANTALHRIVLTRLCYDPRTWVPHPRATEASVRRERVWGVSETPSNTLQYRFDEPEEAPVLILGPSLGTTWHRL
jgi:transposase